MDDLVYAADCDGAVPLASDPDNRYPYAYPRDIASITRAWLLALRAGIDPNRCCERIVDAARFILAVGDDGRWYQRYDLDGTPTAIYVQEDNIAHGMRILAHAVIALEETDALDSVPTTLRKELAETLFDAAAVAREALYDPNAHLVESTTSIHEGRIESGYTLWVNCAFVAALRYATAALSVLHEDPAQKRDELGAFRSLLEAGVERGFAVDGYLVPRRYTPDGDRDERPDITLFAPYYFGLEDLFGAHADRAANRAADSLEDPRLGGLQRFQGFHRDFEVHQHGGNGPWMQYTAWHAQYRFDRGEHDRGDHVLESITRHATADGLIPEHLSTRERFEAFLDHEWDTGADYQKEFDPEVLRDVSFDLLVEELGHMQQSYREMEIALEGDDVISFAEPLAWCHAEFLVALLRRAERGA
ncbi:glucoamylase [Haloferacaceae archaeon DSL9]